MNPLLLAIIGLRSTALALSLAGEGRGSNALYALADLVEAGLATDAHMAAVAEKLKAGPITDVDWDDVEARITEDRNRLHGP